MLLVKIPSAGSRGEAFLLGVVDHFGFAQDVNLDLAGVGEFVLDLLGDVAGQKDHLVLTDGLGLDHDADLAAGLDGVGARDARKALGNLLQLFEALDIVLDVLTAGAGARGRDGIGSLNQTGDRGMRFDIVVVGLDEHGCPRPRGQ